MMNIVDDFALRHEITYENYLASKGISLQRAFIQAGELPAHVHSKHLLIIYQSPGVLIERDRGAVTEAELFSAGDVGLYPAGEYGKVAWKSSIDNIFIYLENKALLEFAETRADTSGVTLLDRFRASDPLISAVGKRLVELNPEDKPIAQLYFDSLCDTLMYHLITHYGEKSKTQITDTFKLSEAVIKRIDDFILSNMSRPINLKMLADLAHCSVFHFSCRFKASTGSSPYHYVLLAKLKATQHLVRNTRKPIADIAHILGFNSVSNFDLFFRKHTGLTPGKYRKH